MYRYLHKNSYSLPITLSLLLDTIKWRLTNQVDLIRISDVIHFLNQPLVYFQRDCLDRPVLMIQLAYLPRPIEGQDSIEFLSPLVIFVLETARLLLCKEEEEDLLLFHINVLIDFKNTTLLPIDIHLFKSLLTLLRRYPDIINVVHILHFNWMYQSLWQVCKLILSNEAKSKINFTTLKELEQDLMIELEGYQWDLTNDIYFMKYRPDLIYSNISSRCSSSTSIYQDILEFSTSHPSSPPPSLYTTPLASPITSHTNLTQLVKVYSTCSLVPSIKPAILTINTTNDPPSRGWFMGWMLRMESTIRYLVLRTLKRMAHYKGTTLYWVMAGVLLRHDVHEICQHIFVIMMDVLRIGKPPVPNSIGMRTVLGLTAGQMAL